MPFRFSFRLAKKPQVCSELVEYYYRKVGRGMKQFLDVLRRIRAEGVMKEGVFQRVGALTIPGNMSVYDLNDGFPLVTTRDLSGSWKAIRAELLWFLTGSSNAKDLEERYGCKLWNDWAEAVAKDPNGGLDYGPTFGFPQGEIGPVYGRQWIRYRGVIEYVRGEGRKLTLPEYPASAKIIGKWGNYNPVTRREEKAGVVVEFNQVAEVVDLLKSHPDTRRAIITAWNPVDLHRSWIMPCHCFFQFVHAQGELSLILYQRSNDVPVGNPFNIAEYSLLLMMMAQVVGMKPRYFVHAQGDVHIYADQLTLVDEQLQREPRPLPTVKINPDVKDIFAFTLDDFELTGYDPHPKMKYPVAL